MTATKVREAKPVSDRQRTLIADLAREVGYDITELDWDALEGQRGGSASQLIGTLFDLRDAQRQAAGQGTTRARDQRDVEPGMYRLGNAVYRVVISREGNWYAEVARLRGETVDWKYIGRRINLGLAEKLIGMGV